MTLRHILFALALATTPALAADPVLRLFKTQPDDNGAFGLFLEDGARGELSEGLRLRHRHLPRAELVACL